MEKFFAVKCLIFFFFTYLKNKRQKIVLNDVSYPLRGERPPKPKGFESGANTPAKVEDFAKQNRRSKKKGRVKREALLV